MVPAWQEKIIVNVTNAYGVPPPEKLGGLPSAKFVAQAFTAGKLVKDFNHLGAAILEQDPAVHGGKRVVYQGSDDEGATAEIAALAKDLGFAVVKLGGLLEGGLLVQAQGNAWGQLIFQAALKLFGDKGGNVINISSGASNMPLPGGSLYSATKAALDAITIALPKELGTQNIRINSILPGATDTEGAASAGVTSGSNYEKMFVEKTPLGRRGQPEDIAKAAVFLASDDAAWITVWVLKFIIQKMEDNEPELLIDGDFTKKIII